MPETMKRIKVGTNTEALMKMVEEVDDMQYILILYQPKDGPSGFLHVGETEVQTLNWMVDRFKCWLFGPHDDDD